jgi:hypothetical protein
MMVTKRFLLLFASIASVTGVPAVAADLQPGPVELQSAGPLTMTDSGVLIVGDPIAAAIYAIDTEEGASTHAGSGPQIDDLKAELAKALNVESSQINIGDMTTNEVTGNVFLSLSAGDANHLVRISPKGEVTKLNLDKVAHAKKSLPNPPENKVTGEGRRQKNRRAESITDLSFFDGKVLVSGLTATESPSTVMEIPYPFSEETILTNVELFHAAHGRVESDPAIRAFVTMTIDGKPTVLAGFTCTPLVAFPIEKMGQQEKLRGKTLAELGNRNQPLDMISYEQGTEKYLLISNSARGVMKVSLADVEKNPGLTEPVGGGGTAGQPFETIQSLKDVKQMARYDEKHATIITETEGGKTQLKTVKLP